MEQTSDSNKLCRLCAEERDVTIMLYSEEAESMFLEEKLRNYLNIKIHTNDSLPKSICLKCINNVQMICAFMEGVHRAQAVLQEYYEARVNSHLLRPALTEDTKEKSSQIITSNRLKLSEQITGSLTYSDDVTITLITSGNNIEEEMPEINKEIEKAFDIPAQIACQKCIECFGTEESLILKNHFLKHSADTEDNKLHRFYCLKCSVPFKNQIKFAGHLKLVHPNSEKCLICGISCSSENTSSYTEHMNSHILTDMPFVCKFCSCSYQTQDDLTSHLMSQHTKRCLYECIKCIRSFKRDDKLKLHKCHNPRVSPFKCQFCDETFTSFALCHEHQMSKHPDKLYTSHEKSITPKHNTEPGDSSVQIKTSRKLRYPCSFCNHSFLKSENLMSHMYQHTGEKPYKCNLCLKAFFSRRTLRFHVRKIHYGIM